jgi:hypothetical protein
MNLSDLTIRVAADTSPLKQGINEINSQVRGMNQSFEKTFQQMGQSFTRGFTQSAKNDVKDIRGILGSLVQSMEQSFLRGYVNTLGKNAAGQGPLGSIATGVFSGGWVSDLTKMILGGKAAGGNVAGGSPVMVGERGPELFVPHSGGKIVNNQNINGGMGGNINLHMTVITPDAGSFRASQGQILSEAAQSIARARRNL